MQRPFWFGTYGVKWGGGGLSSENYAGHSKLTVHLQSISGPFVWAPQVVCGFGFPYCFPLTCTNARSTVATS